MRWTAAFLAVFILAQPAGAAEVRIGVVSAQTGAAAAYDAPFLQGVQMYAEEANARGGFNGRDRVRIIVRDDRSDVQQAAIAAGELLAGEKLTLFITGASAPQAIAAGRQAIAAGLLTVHGIASQPAIPRQLGEGSYLVMMSDAHMGAAYARFARETLQARTAWILTSDFDPYTEFLPLYFKDRFEADGGRLLGHSAFAYDQQEFSSIVSAIKSAPEVPDVIMAMPMDNDFPVFINQLRAGGVASTYLGPDILDQPAVKGLGPVVEGVHYLTMAAPETGPEAAAFLARYEAKSGDGGSAYPAMVGYAFMRLAEAAIARAGSTDAAAIRRSFGTLSGIRTEIGEVTYDGYGPLPNLPVHVMRIEKGEGVYVTSVRLKREEIPGEKF